MHRPIPDRSSKVIVVLDVVESVRLMERDEAGFIRRWQSFVRHALDRVLPRHGGHMRKSLGDGLMLEFADGTAAMEAAHALLQLAATENAVEPADRHMRLRMAAHVTGYVADEFDIYGSGVNLTARLLQLAPPGEILVTAAMGEQLAHGMLEDWGPRQLRHVSQPVHIFRVVRHAAPQERTEPPDTASVF